MDEATGEAEGSELRVAFDRRLKFEFHGATVTSDAGLLAFRELDDALGLTELAGDVLADSRTGRNSRHSLLAQFRQAVFGRLAGYEDVNDADRLGGDPAMRWIVGGRAVTEQAASASQMGRFETSAMTWPTNLAALADLSRRWIDRVQARRDRTALLLDIDSSVTRPTARTRARPTTATSSAPATTLCSCSIRTVTWIDAHCARATSTARTAGATCSIPWWRAIAARQSGAYDAAMRPSPCPTCTGTLKRRASSTRFVCPPIRCSRRRSRRSSRGRWVGHRTTSGASMRASAIRRKVGAVRVGWSRRSSVQLHALAYHLANFLRTLALPGEVERWSLTTLRDKVVKIGAKVISHGRYVIFQMAEVAVPRELFGCLLSRIARLRPPDPVPC